MFILTYLFIHVVYSSKKTVFTEYWHMYIENIFVKLVRDNNYNWSSKLLFDLLGFRFLHITQVVPIISTWHFRLFKIVLLTKLVLLKVHPIPRGCVNWVDTDDTDWKLQGFEWSSNLTALAEPSKISCELSGPNYSSKFPMWEWQVENNWVNIIKPPLR